jgi:hypothetical protein
VRRGLIDDTTAVILLFGPAVTDDLEMGGHALEPAAVEGNATMGPAPAPACPPGRRLRKLSGEILLDYPQGTPEWSMLTNPPLRNLASSFRSADRTPSSRRSATARLATRSTSLSMWIRTESPTERPRRRSEDLPRSPSERAREPLVFRSSSTLSSARRQRPPQRRRRGRAAG